MWGLHTDIYPPLVAHACASRSPWIFLFYCNFATLPQKAHSLALMTLIAGAGYTYRKRKG